MSTSSSTLHILLDAGYGIPRETRPRQEKIYAISRQIANFLLWQLLSKQQEQKQNKVELISPVTVFGCKDQDMKDAIIERLKTLMASSSATAATASTTTVDDENKDDADGGDSTENDNDTAGAAGDDAVDFSPNNNDSIPGLPRHFSFARDEEHTTQLLEDAIYLSPDAPTALNPCQAPPEKVIVGLLIDRRVQLNRSLQRSEKLNLEAKHWPLMDTLLLTSSDNDEQHQYHKNEPLNVDTILEALQQWKWNMNEAGDVVDGDDTPFIQASIQAFRHHAERHPSRPTHR